MVPGRHSVVTLEGYSKWATEEEGVLSWELDMDREVAEVTAFGEDFSSFVPHLVRYAATLQVTNYDWADADFRNAAAHQIARQFDSFPAIVEQVTVQDWTTTVSQQIVVEGTETFNIGNLGSNLGRLQEQFGLINPALTASTFGSVNVLTASTGALAWSTTPSTWASGEGVPVRTEPAPKWQGLRKELGLSD
jgi:hypothetical protein